MMTRIDNNSLRPLRPRSLVALLLAMFAIALGYGFLLPILPSMIARIAETSDPTILARHTGVLIGTYTLALFLFAPLWGGLSDRYGQRPAIVAGLVGFASTLLLFAMAGSLSSLYLGCFLNGVFAASIAAAAYAFPKLAILAAGIAAVPFASSDAGTAVVVAMIAASAGILSPVVTYWISLSAGKRQGADLGWQTTSASLGQAAGSAAGGLLFGVTFIPNASFTLTAIVVLAGLGASIGVPRLLKQPERGGPTSPASAGAAAEEGRRS